MINIIPVNAGLCLYLQVDGISIDDGLDSSVGRAREHTYRVPLNGVTGRALGNVLSLGSRWFESGSRQRNVRILG